VQSRQNEADGKLYVPPVQLVQFVAPLRLYVPDVQPTQTDEFDAL